MNADEEIAELRWQNEVLLRRVDALEAEVEVLRRREQVAASLSH